MITTELQDVQDFNTDAVDFDYYFKIVLIGDSSVGKSCIAIRYARGVFEETLSTIGAEFYWKEQVEDGVLLVFDLNNYDSFEKVFSYWLPEMLIKSVIAVIGNKSDLDHKVRKEQVLEKMEQYKLKHYIETSAKKDDNISGLFGTIVKEILHKIKEDPDLVSSMNEKKIPELKKQAPQDSGCKC